MGKRESNEARIMRLYSELSDEGKRIIFELLKGQQVPVKRAIKKKAASASTKGKIDIASPAQDLAAKTGRFVEDCQAALDANAGNKKAALLALTAER